MKGVFIFIGILVATAALSEGAILSALIIFAFFTALGIWLDKKFTQKSKEDNNDAKNESVKLETSTTSKKTDENIVHKGPSKDYILNSYNAEEVSYNYVKLTHKKYTYIVPQDAPKSLETFPERDLNDNFPSNFIRKNFVEAFNNFKPITRDGDNRHIIKLDNFLSYGLESPSKNERFELVDKKYKNKLTLEYGYGDEEEFRPRYLKVKTISKYIDSNAEYNPYFIEIGDLDNNYIFADKISVFSSVYEKAEIGKEIILIKDVSSSYSLYNVEFFD